MMQVTGAIGQTLPEPELEQATDPKSHHLVSSFYTPSVQRRYLRFRWSTPLPFPLGITAWLL